MQQRGSRAAEPYLTSEYGRRVELGCGRSKQHPEAIGVDQLDFAGVDLVGPIPEVLSSLPAASIDVVYSSHFLEHVESMPDVMSACARILRPGGAVHRGRAPLRQPLLFERPDTSHAIWAVLDVLLRHRRVHRRQVPKYVLADSEIDFELISADLRFGRSWRRPVSRIVDMALERASQRSTRFRSTTNTGSLGCFRLRRSDSA